VRTHVNLQPVFGCFGVFLALWRRHTGVGDEEVQGDAAGAEGLRKVAHAGKGGQVQVGKLEGAVGGERAHVRDGPAID
jgi:hypothetical protein